MGGQDNSNSVCQVCIQIVFSTVLVVSGEEVGDDDDAHMPQNTTRYAM